MGQNVPTPVRYRDTPIPCFEFYVWTTWC